MSQPLTLEHFDETMRTIADVLTDHSTKLTAIADILKDHTERLDRIEHILWDGARFDEIERRVIKLAETVGRPDLATPISRPIGS